VDAEGGEIKGTFFRKVADAHFDRIVEGATYTFYGATVGAAKKAYQATSHPCELIFNDNAVISPVLDGSSIKPSEKIVLQPTLFRSLEGKNMPLVVDLVGVCITPLMQKAYKKKKPDGSTTDASYVTFTIVDETSFPLTVTLFDQDASLAPRKSMHRFFGIKNARVAKFNGSFSVKLGASSVLVVDPDPVQTESLRAWYHIYKDSDLIRNIRQGNNSNNTAVLPLSTIDGPIIPLSEYDKFPKSEVSRDLNVKITTIMCEQQTLIRTCYIVNGREIAVEQDNVNGTWRLVETGETIPSPDQVFRLRVKIADKSLLDGIFVTLPNSIIEHLTSETTHGLSQRLEQDKENGRAICNDFLNRLTGRDNCIFKLLVTRTTQDKDRLNVKVESIYC
jgi:hypothetical protein